MFVEMIKYVGGTTLAIGAVAWLIRTLTVHLLDKDVSLYKNNLQRFRELELEQFTLFNQKRADVIAELYSHLLDFYFAAEAYLDWKTKAPKKLDEETYDVLNKAFEKYMMFFQKNDIYFSEELCSLLVKFQNKILDEIGKLVIHRTRIEEPDYDQSGDGALRVELYLSLKEKVYPIKEAIKNEFRNLHGVHIDLKEVEQEAKTLNIKQ